jgi:hypothetical protein
MAAKRIKADDRQPFKKKAEYEAYNINCISYEGRLSRYAARKVEMPWALKFRSKSVVTAANVSGVATGSKNFAEPNTSFIC